MKLAQAKLGDRVFVYLTDGANGSHLGDFSCTKTTLKVSALVCGKYRPGLLPPNQVMLGFDAASGIRPTGAVNATVPLQPFVYNAGTILTGYEKLISHYTWTPDKILPDNIDCEPISGLAVQSVSTKRIEKPCKVCQRKNDFAPTPAKSCWWCSSSPF